MSDIDHRDLIVSGTSVSRGGERIDPASIYLAPAQSAADAWRSLYARAVNEANGLTNYVEDRPELRRAERKLAQIEAEASALYAAPQPAPVTWVSAAERKPASGQTVLACYVNSANKVRRIRAHWIAAKTVEGNVEDDFGEYDEATDTFWTPEGWYEQIDNWGDYSAVKVCEGEVSHWMPLPEAPDGIGAPA